MDYYDIGNTDTLPLTKLYNFLDFFYEETWGLKSLEHQRRFL